MAQQAQDLIIGIHSIVEALKNPDRSHQKLVATKDGIEELKRKGDIPKNILDKLLIEQMSSHKLQEEAKKIFSRLELNYQRVPSGVFLLTSPVEIFDVSWIYQQLKGQRPLRLLCLDNITDIHNGAAIIRTAAFYGIDAIIMASKGSFRVVPTFSRIASGALEYVKLIKCSSLPKTLKKMKENGIECIGLSEHATVEITKNSKIFNHGNSICLVLGAEDVGLSNAVERVLLRRVAIETQGKIKSLNVSVAAAVAMEKIFG